MKIKGMTFGVITLEITPEEAYMIARGCYAAACHLCGSSPNADSFADMGSAPTAAVLYEQAEAAFEAYVIIADLSTELPPGLTDFHLARIKTRGLDAMPAPEEIAHPRKESEARDDR